MIDVTNRVMVIPPTERVIGTITDNYTETRTFIVPRTESGIDISALSFRLDLEYPDGTNNLNTVKDSMLLDKVLGDTSITLIWTVTADVVLQTGTIFAQIRGCDTGNIVRWTSLKGSFYVEDAINSIAVNSTDTLAEIRQLEAKIDVVLAAETAREALKSELEVSKAAYDAIVASYTGMTELNAALAMLLNNSWTKENLKIVDAIPNPPIEGVVYLVKG